MPGRDFDLAIDGEDLVLAQQRAVGARSLPVDTCDRSFGPQVGKFQLRKNADGLNRSCEVVPTVPITWDVVRMDERRLPTWACQSLTAPTALPANEARPVARSHERLVSFHIFD